MRRNSENRIDHAKSAAQDHVEQSLVDTVLASFDETQDARFHTIICSLVQHLHSFIREVRLSETEWTKAIAFLTATGQISTAARDEFVLLSDVLGASMQTIGINNAVNDGSTESTIFGPFFAEGSPLVELGGDIAQGASGQPCWVHGTVTDTAGDPVPGARIEVWQADDTGMYDAQYNDPRVAGRAHLFADEDGRYRFWGLTPTPYPIPHDGPVGELLVAAGRSPMRAAHLHFMVTATARRTLVTHIFVRGDEHLDSDAVFGVKESLIHAFKSHSLDVPAPDSRDLGGRDWTEVQFDIVLAPLVATSGRG